ncbi:hypothetical protein BSL82_03710 [Tardibacter chloracetimidivorans]|uniref:Peptidase S74 domain-containing protein n=1 Tax=Tardibacter chloracetimidivorans TaxID=1921510 RepID=A0A1L3ZSC4_9SPHN|nr:tail fiber domain-containing protein [Tardibacter chloracetimidivorans]API58523.1 hypothetical protein BSL82_03710 [Tardibacter chloracetimidivorans]
MGSSFYQDTGIDKDQVKTATEVAAEQVAIATEQASIATTKATDAAASATAAASSESDAETAALAAAASETAAATSESNAAASAATATTKAAEADASAVTAAAEAATATTKAAEADASAGAASSSAAAAATSEANAAASEANASTSETNAASSAAAAASEVADAIAALTKADVGLDQVDNTSDADKPVSTAQAAAIAAKIDKSTFDAADQVLTSSGASTPTKVALTASTVLGRGPSGGIVALPLNIDPVGGHVGIVTTPAPWSGSFKALNLGNGANFIAGSGGTTLVLGVNAYHNGTVWKRPQGATSSTLMLADSGSFYWSFGASGAAGGDVTFADRMRLVQNAFGGGMLDIYGAAGVLAIRLDSSGTITSTGTYSATTANAANMYVHTDGSFNRSTSSLRYKNVLEPIADEWAYKLLDLDGIFYKSKCEADNQDWTYYGFGAEDVAQIDPRWVHWKTQEYAAILANGQEPELVQLPEPVADGVQYERMVVALQHIAKREKARADDAEARLNAIEARLAALEAA